MLKGLFRPKEVKAALLTLDIVQQRAPNSAFALIKNDIRHLLVDQADKTVHSIREDRLSCETLIHLLMTNVLARHLCSGAYHTYRCILSMQGEHLLKLWDYAVEQLLESGFYDQSKADDEERWVRAEMKKVG